MAAPRRALAALVAAAAAAGLAAWAMVPGEAPGVTAWRIAADITEASTGTAVPFWAFNPTNLQWVDVDADGTPEILSPNTNGRWYLFAPDGTLRSELPWPLDRPPEEATQPGAVVADLDRDGRREVYVLGNAGRLQAYEHDPALDREPRLGLRFLWERCLACTEAEHDGTPWAAGGRLFTQHDGAPHAWAVGPDGAVAWHVGGTEGNAGPVAADLERDGALEVVFATDGGAVMARDAADGSVRWWRDVGAILGVEPGSIPAQPTVADLDGDGRSEVLVCLRDAPPAAPLEGRAALALLGHDGGLRWATRPPGAHGMCNMHPAVLDATGDGTLDALWLDWNTLGHLPGAFEHLGPAHLHLLDGRDGRVAWTAEVDSAWSDDDPCVADADGDGALEVLVPARRGGREGLGLWDLRGSPDGWWPAPEGWAVARGALCAALEGRLHLVLSLVRPEVAEGVQSPDGTSRSGRILVVDTGAPFRAAWTGQYEFAS